MLFAKKKEDKGPEPPLDSMKKEEQALIVGKDLRHLA